jgi:putative heme-binding domain-containing protein
MHGVIIALLCLLTATARAGQSQTGGNAAAGKALYEERGDCVRCHAIDQRGGSLGPELSWIGVLRSSESLRRSLMDPNAQIDPQFYTVTATTRTGETIEGLALNQDDVSIQLRDTQRQLRPFRKSDLTNLRRVARSLMPSYSSRFSATEIEDLVTYLRTLRTMPPVEPAAHARPVPRHSTNVPFFTRPDRDVQERSSQLIEALEIPVGSVVADIGSGSGYFTWRLARAVGPTGSVTAVDIQKHMLELTAEEVNRQGLSNVQYTLSSPRDPGLPANSLDMIFVGYAYHEFTETEAMLAALHRALKPSGRLVILEYAKESPVAPASLLHKMSLSEIRGEIEPRGFALTQLLDFLPMQHCAIFVKKN